MMLLQKLTKSYSSSLPTYVPIPTSLSSYSHPSSLPDHETGSFSCTYSPQHSLGVARINLQSAQINEPEGWKSWFKRTPSTWVKVKVLGRTNVVGSKHGRKARKGKGQKNGEIGDGEMKTWREERVVGRTEVCEQTYTPNYGFKSYHALLGPYEHQLELEVHSKKRFSWLYPRGAKSTLLGTASFLFPPSVHAAVIHRPDNATGEAEWYEGSSEHQHEFTQPERRGRDERRAPSPGMLEAVLTAGSRGSFTSSRSHSHSRSRTVHEEGAEEERTEWAVQAALFNPDLSAVEGYLFFNVFWYPAIPVQVPLPAFRSREDVGGDEAPHEFDHEQHLDDYGGDGDGGGAIHVGLEPMPQGQPRPGIVTFTLHSIHALDICADAQMEATISLGWRSKPLHQCRALKADRRSRQSSPSTSYRGEKPARRRVVNSSPYRDGGHNHGTHHDDGEVEKDDDGREVTVTRFDSPFEFLCMDPTTTNIVVKVYEVTHHQGFVHRTRKEVVGHTSVPLLDLMQPQIAPPAAAQGTNPQDLNAQLAARRESGRKGRDRMLALLEHPTGKAKVCAEWRALRIPEVSHVKHAHE